MSYKKTSPNLSKLCLSSFFLGGGGGGGGGVGGEFIVDNTGGQ